MSSNEQALFDKLKALPPQQRAEVEDSVDFLTAKARKRAATDRLLAIAPALEAADAGVAAAELVEDYAGLAEIVVPASFPAPVSRDPDDDLVLAAALGAEASPIVTGDRDLLVLGTFRDIRILAAADALAAISR